MRVKPPQPALLEALRRQEQVDAEGPADPADLDEEVDQLGPGGEQLGELVADDEQVRQRVAVAAVGVVVDDAGEISRRPQQLLTADDLAGQSGLHPLDQGELCGEIGDQRRDVRQLGQPGEGCATFEVDEDEVEHVRAVLRDEREHEGAQQLGLAGARGADEQAVRTGPALGGLLEVEDHR